ncbi:MAG: VWA domain-containing protein [Acidobacteriia bacterium]|nr:VWA domain-containing protein [Terriglobia bacterium]
MRCLKWHAGSLFVALSTWALAGLSAVALAQGPSQRFVSPEDLNDVQETGLTISKRVDEVNLVFTVTNSKGHFISNLTAGDLKLMDNHQPPQRIGYFQQQSNLPLRVALLIDLSDSIRGRFEYEKQAAGMFLKRILRPEVDEAFVVGFNGKVNLVQDTTGDVDELAKSIHTLASGGDTALYDAIVFAADKLRSGTESRVTRRAIILITDGMDTASKGIMTDAENATVRAEAVMYALSTNSPLERYPKGDAVLDLLTNPSGGHILPAHEKADLKAAFKNVEEALRSQYALGYHPAGFRLDGSFHPIEILPHKRGLNVQCRKGYFAPRQPSNP